MAPETKISDQDLRKITGISSEEEAKVDDAARKLEEALIAESNGTATDAQKALIEGAEIGVNIGRSDAGTGPEGEPGVDKQLPQQGALQDTITMPILLPPQTPEETPLDVHQAQQTKPRPRRAPVIAQSAPTEPVAVPELPQQVSPEVKADTETTDDKSASNSGNDEDVPQSEQPTEDDNPPVPQEQEPLTYGFTVAEQTSDVDNKGSLYLKRRQEEYVGRGRNGFSRFIRRGFTIIGGAGFRRRWARDFAQTVRGNEGLVDAPLEETYGLSVQEAIESAQRAKAATLERVADGYLAQDADERGVALAEDDNATHQLRDAIKSIALRYADGQLTDDQIIAERDRLFGQIQGLNPELFSESAYTIDDLRTLLCDVRADIEHGIARERVEAALDNITLRGAITHSSARTHHRASWVDRLEGHTRVSVLGAGSAAMLGAGIAMDLTRRGTMSTLGAAIRVFTVGFVSGAVLAGIQAAYGFRRDASFARLEHTYGVDHDLEGNKKRRQTAEVIHNTEYAPDLIQSLQETLVDGDRFVDGMDNDGLIAVTQVAQRIKTLMSESDTRGIDFIRFSGISEASVERLELMRTLDKIEVATAAYLQDHGSELLPIDLQQQQVGNVTLEVAIRTSNNMVASATTAILEQDIELRDKNYRNLMIRRAAIGALVGGVTAGIVGITMQEIIAGFNPKLDGIFETQTPGSSNTMLNSMIFGQHNGPNMGPGAILGNPSGTTLVTNHGSNVHLTIPDTMQAHFSPSNPNSFDLIAKSDGTVLAHNLEVLPNGQISPASLQILHNSGFETGQQGFLVNGPSHRVNSGQFIESLRQKGEVSDYQLKDAAWNQIPGQIGDHNELDLHAAGHGGNWQMPDGSVRIGIDGLKENGSWSPTHTYNVEQALAEGRGKIVVTLNDSYQSSGVYQSEVFNVVKDSHGTGWHAVIPKDNPLVHWFSKGGSDSRYHGPSLEQLQNPHSHALDSRNSLGFFIEEKPIHGIRQMVDIASIPGTGKPIYQVPTPHEVVESWIKPTISAGEGETLPAVGPPIYVPRGMGLGRRSKKPKPNPYGRGYGGYNEQEKAKEYAEGVRTEVSPTMLAGEPLDLAKEAKWYKKALASDFGEEYVKKIDKLIKSSPELQNLPSATKAIVAIPVRAVSEADNIYATLSLYAQQEKVAPGSFTIVLGINTVKGQMDDPAKRLLIEKTLSEIERAKKDFPQLRIAVINYEMTKDEIQNGAIGVAARTLYDSVAIAAGEHAAKTPDIGDDILIIRNDADSRGLSRRYIERYIKAFGIMGTAHAFRGPTEFDTTADTSNFPGFRIITGFDKLLTGFTARRTGGKRDPGYRVRPLKTAGANFAIRASSYAAMRGMGSDMSYTGVASEDLGLGDRLRAGLGDNPSRATYNDTGNYSAGSDSTTLDTTPIRYVGAQLDTNGYRGLSRYLDGKHPDEAWESYDSGPDHYEPRGDIDLSGPRESFETTLKNVEKHMSASISVLSRADAEYLLARYFGDVKCFRITVDGSGKPSIRFTKKGKEWLRDIIQRDESIAGGGIAQNLFNNRLGRSSRQRFVRIKH